MHPVSCYVAVPVCTLGSRSPDGPSSQRVEPRGAVTRREALHLAAVAAAAVAMGAIARPRPALAELVLGKPSTSDLLHRMERERSEDEIKAARAAREEARAARRAQQLQLQADAQRRRAEGDDGAGAADDIEANLRANYYFPTARKRYLPRVKRALEDLPRAKDAVTASQWAIVAGYVNDGSLADCVLPMRLYASSLSGQGLSLAGKFVHDMDNQAERFESSLKSLKVAVNKQEQTTALAALTNMERSIATYRAAGKLEAPDFGIGEVPKDVKIGSGLGNNNPALYNRNFAMQGLPGSE